jgi:GT2 family glycosyltransferase
VASAKNLGARRARSPLIVFTDDDTEPASGWLESVLDASRRNPDAVGFEGPVVTGDYDVLHFHAPLARPGGCCGANVAYRRADFTALGGFDERFRGWMPDDVELGARAKARGDVVHVPTMVVHHPPRAIGLHERIQQASGVEGIWLLFRKHPSLSRWRVPLRWGPAAAELQRWLGLLTRRDVVRGSPERAARIVVLALCTTVSAGVAGWRRWPGQAA